MSAHDQNGTGDPLRPADSAAQDPGSLHGQASGTSGAEDQSKHQRKPIDPELEEDLGDELGFRGDQVDAELESLKGECEQWRDKALRATADLDNFRKRTERERADERQRAGERIVGELMPVVDNLERAIEHTTAGGDVEQLLGGVEAVHAQLLRVLEAEGVEIIDPFGEAFDPHRHQAVGQREDDEVAEGTVVEVLLKGAAMGGRVVRPAMVVVSIGGPPAGK